MSPQKSSKIKLTFTALALGLREANIAIPLWHESRDWDDVADKVFRENLFQKPSIQSTRRIFREIRHRLACLSDETLEAFVEMNHDEKCSLLFLATCKCYPLVHRFIAEVLYEKVAVFDYSVRDEDFNSYWNQLATESDAFNSVSDTARKKTKQVMFRMLAEAGLLSSTKKPQITPIYLSGKMEEIIRNEAESFRGIFLT